MRIIICPSHTRHSGDKVLVEICGLEASGSANIELLPDLTLNGPAYWLPRVRFIIQVVKSGRRGNASTSLTVRIFVDDDFIRLLKQTGNPLLSIWIQSVSIISVFEISS